MLKAVWAAFCLAAILGLLSSCAWAVERELVGVSLGDEALDLLDRPGFGEPLFIGPLGALSYISSQQQPARAAATAAVRTGPTGPSLGGTAGGARLGVRSGLAGMRAGGPGAARGMGRGTIPAGAAPGGGGAALGGPRAGARAAVAPGPAAQFDTAGMYWYYRRLGGDILVLSLNSTGQVKAITLTGNSPLLQGRTTRGVGLTTSYMELISQYGYPDQVITAGNTIELTYLDHGVRFALDNMRVREISIGTHIGRPVEAAPEAEPAGAPPPAGLTPEELQGYL
jgi:hypothetical protein